MRNLYITRGIPGAGKSTWINKNNLKQYSISPDTLRLLNSSPTLNVNGNFRINSNNDSKIWKDFFKLLEFRMSNGDLTIVDATSINKQTINKYKQLCKEYKYRLSIIDFTQISLDTVCARNKQRKEYKQVSYSVCSRMYAALKENNIKMISKEEALKAIQGDLCISMDNYDSVVVFGDIHGCYTPLKEYFTKHPFNEKTKYIFCGDYLDRGIENRETLTFLISICDKENVLLLEGNHEKWLHNYVYANNTFDIPKNDKDVLLKYYSHKDINKLNKSNLNIEFRNNTLPQIKDIPKKDIKNFLRRLGQMAYFTFKSNNYVICHGGISSLPSQKVSTKDYIRGSGRYQDLEEVYAAWDKNTATNTYLIHGHRNIQNYPIMNKTCINLNDTIESGGNLRIVTLDAKGITPLYIKNTKYNLGINNKSDSVDNLVSSNSDIQKMIMSPLIKKKRLADNIISYNFTRKVFYSKLWNSLNTKARGLFINSKTDNIVARSYNKFFNYQETKETSLQALSENLEFPVTAYKKENGFLGLVSWDSDAEEVFISSKGTNEGPFAAMVKEQFNALPNKNNIIEWLKEYNFTLVFEVIDIIKDPHIIEYDKSKLVLLDIVANKHDFNNLNYNFLTIFSQIMNLECKEKFKEFNTQQELLDFLNVYSSNDDKHEGFVIVDENNFHFKLKTEYYNKWKSLRRVLQRIIMKKPIGNLNYNDATTLDVVKYMQEVPSNELLNKSIIDIRNAYYKHLEE